MFFSRHLHLVILCYVLLILMMAGTGIALIITGTGVVMGCLAIIASLFIIQVLVRRLNKFNTRLRLFVDAIEDKENMIQFNEHSSGKEMNDLNHALNRINELLAVAKSDCQRQERFYYSLLEEIPNGVVAWDSEGKIILANNTALLLLGFEQFVSLRQLEQQYPEIKGFLSQRNIPKSIVIHSIGKRQLSLSMNYMKLESESITLLSIKDISNELSEKESESWSKLTHVLTHEIMNTIAPIVSLSQTLSTHSNTDAKVIRGLNVIRSQSERLMEFTESYRHFSYMPDPIKKTFSLTDVIHNIGILLQSDFEMAHIRFVLRSNPDNITVEGDEKQLSQVFLNLFKNSIQALEGEDNGKIEVNLVRTETLHIYIIDNGKGIPAELQERVFVPFFTTKAEGMGIGLSLCRQIIKKHGGDFYLQESRKGRTIFMIEWPE